MISFEPELSDARDNGVLTPATAARLIALQRREVFSLFGEVRALAWIGAMLAASGISLLISNHIKDIGVLTMQLVLAAAAAGCYAWTWTRRDRQSLVSDSILLLGGMIASADAGWIASDSRILLFLAVFHAVGAYVYKSRSLLSLSIGALAGWLGVERNLDMLVSRNLDLALRGFGCAAILALWREIDRRVRPSTTFTPVFEHTAITFAFWSALIVATNNDTASTGLLITLILAAASAHFAFRTNTETFLLYAAIYSALAIDAWAWNTFNTTGVRSLVVLITAVAVVAILFALHRRFRK
ncbi:MAG TPA: hypothetical protein VJ901_05915 [Thermoanaerobaculia bacterium]|nr:hypothetical protein [Thermoanaerobaculia bacterium]